MEEEPIETTPKGIIMGTECYKFFENGWHRSSVAVPEEMALDVFINGQELVTILCTPTKLNCLVLGFLYGESIISGLNDVASMRICEDDSLADVRLSKTEFVLPKKRILTSGCGGGAGFTSEPRKMVSGVPANIAVTPGQISSLMKLMMRSADLYNLSGGIHTSTLCDTEKILVQAEDIGRHNTLDKIQGECLLRKIPTNDKILLTSGRVSSEMMRKAASMQTPVVASLTSPTDKAIRLARDSNISLIGYVRGGKMLVYSGIEKLAGVRAKN